MRGIGFGIISFQSMLPAAVGIRNSEFGIRDSRFEIRDYLLSVDAACGGWDLEFRSWELGFNAKKKEGQILLKRVPLFSKLC